MKILNNFSGEHFRSNLTTETDIVHHSLPPPMSDFPDQENDELEEDLSQMMNTKALLSHERLCSRMNQIIAPKDIGELLIDARIEGL